MMMRIIHIVVVALLAAVFDASAHTADDIDQSRRYSVNIDFAQAGISGVCIMREQSDDVLGAIVNEFGVLALNFSYDTQRGKVKIIDIIPQLNKWYIRRVLRGDLQRITPALMAQPTTENYEYINQRRKIKYLFTPI